MLKVDRGEVSEWSNVHAWKACVVKSNRGFKSRPLRQEILSFKKVRLGVFALNFFCVKIYFFRLFLTINAIATMAIITTTDKTEKTIA